MVTMPAFTQVHGRKRRPQILTIELHRAPAGKLLLRSMATVVARRVEVAAEAPQIHHDAAPPPGSRYRGLVDPRV